MMQRRVVVAMLAALAAAPGALAHNNAQYEKTEIMEVEVTPNSGAEGRYAEPFDLELPKNALQLFYEVESEEAESIRFSIESGDRSFEGLKSGDKTKLLRESVTITDVSGATAPFTLKVIAEILVR